MAAHGAAPIAEAPEGVKYIGNRDIIIIAVMMTMTTIMMETTAGGRGMMMTEPLHVRPDRKALINQYWRRG